MIWTVIYQETKKDITETRKSTEIIAGSYTDALVNFTVKYPNFYAVDIMQIKTL